MNFNPWPITFCGVSFDESPDADGVRWRVADLDGWDSAPVRMDDGDLTGRHGGFGSPRLWASRLLTLAGRAHCPDMATAFRVRQKVAASMPGVGSGELIFHESVPQGLSVQLNGTPRASAPIDSPPYEVRFQIPLIAHDPFKRSLTPTTTPLSAGSSVAVAHPGTAAADLRVTLTSAGTVVLSAGGVTLRVKSAPSGTVIDTGSTSIVDSTGASLGHLLDGPPMMPALPAGGGTVQQAGTANLSIEHFDTYA